MTPVDLMTHRSGLPRHDLVWYNSPLNRRQMFDRLQHLEPSADFRTTFQYQNLMFMTAGYLAQEMTGHTWEDLVRARLFEPLGMAQFEGKYDMMGQQVITIELNGATLQASIPGQPTYALEPYKEMEFNMKDLSGFSVRFVKQGEQVTEAVITQPNGVFTATRME